MTQDIFIRDIQDLIDRLSRLNAAEDWNGPLNPSQFAALGYLAKANRYSRAPSHVADYLATTRGTASQTLKALARKDLIEERRLEHDKRSIRYDVKKEGIELLDSPSSLNNAVRNLNNDQIKALSESLKAIVAAALQQRGGKSFGICRTCRHHDATPEKPHCRLLDVSLSIPETNQICHEHSPT